MKRSVCLAMCWFASPNLGFTASGGGNTPEPVPEHAPVITRQPANDSVRAGENAIFSVEAAGGTLSFEWQRSKDGRATWATVVDGSGADGATFTTAPTTANDNHALFRVVVGNSTGNTTSNTAELGVTTGSGTPVLLGISGTGNDYAKAICADGDGNILVAGFISGTVDFDPGPGTVTRTSGGITDILLLCQHG